MFLSSSQFCTHCGGKLKVGAKFCTICGTKQTSNRISQQTYNAPTRQTNRTPVQPTRTVSQSSVSSSGYTSRFSPKDESIVNANVEKNSTQGFTLTTLLALETEVDSLTKTIARTEIQTQALAVYSNVLTELNKTATQIDQLLTNQSSVKIFLQNSTWSQVKDYQNKYNLGRNFV